MIKQTGVIVSSTSLNVISATWTWRLHVLCVFLWHPTFNIYKLNKTKREIWHGCCFSFQWEKIFYLFSPPKYLRKLPHAMNERRRNFNWLMSWPEKEFYGRAECADRQETTLIFIECILVIGLLCLDTWKKGERKQQNQRNILQSWEE